jgi:chemotaxis protein CheD
MTSSRLALTESTAGMKPPPPLPGFEHINRYWDKTRECFAAKILPGEYYVTLRDEAVVTVLGSCISACVRDGKTGIGGMNHFMLPSGGKDGMGQWGSSDISESTRFGSYAMERLINDILKHGGNRQNLEIKVFGGGRILTQMTDVGRKNIEFVERYLRTEGLRVLVRDLGDVHPRKVYYMPTSGKAFVKKLRALHNDTIVARETEYLNQLKQQPVAGEVTLF